MLDPHEWAWLEEHARGRLRPPADRHVAAVPARARRCTTWRRGTRRSATAPGAGRRRGSASRCARALDLEHWAAFGSSLDRDRWSSCARSARATRRAAGVDRRAVGRRAPRLPRRGRLPARHGHALGGLPGDLLAVPQPARRPRAARDPLRLRAGRARSSASCSRAPRASATRPCAGASRTTAPFFDNQVCFLELDGRRARLWLQKTVPEENEGYSLETVFEQRARLAARSTPEALAPARDAPAASRARAWPSRSTRRGSRSSSSPRPRPPPGARASAARAAAAWRPAAAASAGSHSRTGAGSSSTTL